MDYWEQVEVIRHIDYPDFRAAIGARRVLAFTTRAETSLWEAEITPDDALLFGPESRGLPERLLDPAVATLVRVPMLPSIRSLNLGTAVGVALYEGLRRTGWRG